MRRCKICNTPLEDWEDDICQNCQNNFTTLGEDMGGQF